MRRTRLPHVMVVLLVAAAGLLLLHACQETPARLTQPSASLAVVRYKLTITGVGGGSGVVTSSPAGINCSITASVPAATGCTALFPEGTVVQLTAKPVSGHSFGGWGISCSGRTTCSVTMKAARSVSAQFLKGPFRVTIVSGTPGKGSGRVTTQAGLTPAINCVITNGTVAATGCTAVYPANTQIVLTGTPAEGHMLVGWGSPCSGAGTCSFTLIKARSPSVTFAPSSLPQQGQWTAPFPWPIVGIHTHLLPTGEVLSFGKKGTPRVWNVSTNAFTGVSSTYLMFCSGHAYLPDGRLLVTGGNISHDHGLPYANIFDPTTRRFTRVAPMAQGRWYPTSTTLANGEVLTTAGADSNAVMVGVPEVWTGSAWRQLSGADLVLPYYPWMFQAPNGSVFEAGPESQTRYLNTEDLGAWTPVATSLYGDRPAGSAVMYEPGKVLIVGGGGGTATSLPTNTAEIIDLSAATPTWQTTGSMAFPRRHLNATLLPTGEVLVIGGTRGPGYNDSTLTIHQAEIWSPETGVWRTVAANAINRIYHSTAILLPDGRVLSAGAGAQSGAVDQLNAEIYSPPYLFQGTRPSITSVPAELSYGVPFTLATSNDSSIDKVTLLRLGSVTHSFDQNQRFVKLTFEAQTGGLSVTSPLSGNIAPPGDYLLFIVNRQGVPSTGRFVRLR